VSIKKPTLKLWKKKDELWKKKDELWKKKDELWKKKDGNIVEGGRKGTILLVLD
jgi:hypothetical protein